MPSDQPSAEDLLEEDERYVQLRAFLASPLWLGFLRPMIERWASGKRDAVDAAKSPTELWDARERARTASEVLPMLDRAAAEMRNKRDRELKGPPKAQ